MTDELENQGVEQLETEAPAETAQATGENQEIKTEFTEEQQAVFNDVIGKKTLKHRQKERELQEQNEALQKQLSDTQAQLPQQTRPEDPAAIDPFDDDLESKTAIRDSVIREQARFDAETAYRQQQDAHSAQLKQQQDQQAYAKSAQAFIERASKLGVSQQELQAAGNTVVQFGLDQTVQQHILLDDQGPLITKYLADNPQEMLSLNGLTPVQAGIFIETQIKQKAIASGTKQPPSAPDPANHLKGGGAAVKDEDGFIEL